MDKYSLGYRDLRADTIQFLKTEGFYVLVLVAVIVIGGWQVYAMLKSDESAVRHLDTVDKKAFLQQVTQDDATANRRTPEKRSYRILSQWLKFALLCGGAATIAILIVLFFMRGRLLPPADGPPAPWGLWDILKVAALFGLVSEGLRFLCVDGGALPMLGRGDWYAVIFARIFLIGCIILVVIEERKGALSQLGLRGPFIRGILIGLAAFVALQAPLGMYEAAEMHYVKRVDLQETLVALVFTRDVYVVVLIAIAAVVVAPVAEELLFRGFLQPAAERWFGTWPAVFLSAVFFAVAHPQFGVMLPMFILGLTSAWLFARTRSLVASITLHAANNAYVILCFLAIRYPGPHS